MYTEPLYVDAYDYLGNPMFRLPYTRAGWQDHISEPGSLSVEMQCSDTALGIPGGLWASMRLWGVMFAAHRYDPDIGGQSVKHAGPLVSYDWDAKSRKLSLDCGGGWSFLSKRLVLNYSLDRTWHDGDVLIDDKHPAGNWLSHYEGSYRDIAAGLVREAMKWGALPIDLPATDGGKAHYRDYYGYDSALVSDRLDDLAKLEDGDEIRFDPYINANGQLWFRLRSESQIMDHYWQDGSDMGAWDATVPGQRVVLSGLTGDGAAMTSQAYATGGKDGDKTLMARAGDTRLTVAGYPLLQSADMEHNTVSDLRTLQGYARSDIAYGMLPDETWKLQVGEEYDARPGDCADLKYEDDFLGEGMIPLKITDVSGSSDSDWLTIQARGRII